MRWKVRIIGDEHELSELSRSLCDANLSLIKNEHGQYDLTYTQFDDCNTDKEVIEVSKRVLSILNGAAKLALGGNLDLTMSEVLEEHTDGTNTFYMHLSDTFYIRDSFTLSIIDSDRNVIEERKPADQVPVWVMGGLKDETVGKIFRLFSQKHDWVGLYRIFEVIENDTGGINEIANLGWSSKGQLKSFKHTANSPNAVGDEARHGKEATEPPKNPMLLSEARALIETLVHHWLRRKGLA